MLEQYFKTKEDFDQYLDDTYDEEKFEDNFEKFLNKLIKEDNVR